MTDRSAHQFRAKVEALLAPYKTRLEALPIRSRLTDLEAESIYALARQLAAQGRTDEAFEHFAFLVSFRPTSTRYLMALASSHRESRRFSDAVGVYRTLDVIDPFNPAYTLAMAECFMHLQDEAAADELLQQVLDHCEADGNHPQVLERARALQQIFQRRRHDDGSP